MVPVESPCALWTRLTGEEPVHLWREYARQAGALLDAAAALASEEVRAADPTAVGPSLEVAEREDVAWSIASREFPPGSTPPPVVQDDLHGLDRIARRRWLLNRGVGLWTNVAGIQLIADVAGAQPVHLGVRSVFGALAVQLLFAAVRAPVMVFCAGGNHMFTPSRMPRRGERSWCDECKDKQKDHKAASNRFRERDAADPYRAKQASGPRARRD
jgi:hypothetical protein